MDRFEGFIDVSPFKYFPEESPFIPAGYQTGDPASVQISTDYTASGLISYACYLPDDESLPDVSIEPRGHLRAEEDLEWFILNTFDYTVENALHYTASIYIFYPDPMTAMEANAAIYPVPDHR